MFLFIESGFSMDSNHPRLLENVPTNSAYMQPGSGKLKPREQAVRCCLHCFVMAIISKPWKNNPKSHYCCVMNCHADDPIPSQRSHKISIAVNRRLLPFAGCFHRDSTTFSFLGDCHLSNFIQGHH